MFPLLDTVHAIGLLTCFALLGTSRIGACIRWLCVQGMLFGLVPVIMQDGGLTIREIFLSAAKYRTQGDRLPLAASATASPGKLQPRGRAIHRLCPLNPVRNSRSGIVCLARPAAEACVDAGAVRHAGVVDLSDLYRLVPDYQPP
jgi:hypothetical protein